MGVPSDVVLVAADFRVAGSLLWVAAALRVGGHHAASGSVLSSHRSGRRHIGPRLPSSLAPSVGVRRFGLQFFFDLAGRYLRRHHRTSQGSVCLWVIRYSTSLLPSPETKRNSSHHVRRPLLSAWARRNYDDLNPLKPKRHCNRSGATAI